MDENTRTVIQACFEASRRGSIHFGQVIAQLMAVGVESYHVDYRSGRTTCHLPGDDTLDISFERPAQAIAEAFDGDALRAAIQGAQQGHVLYPAFMRLSQQAGCTGYSVWIAGRHVSYLGRRGETHVERFPG
ncbi:MAG: DUF1398 family protein [Rubrivivax sp.]|nr:DUF1398 family protein [Rubrivivax sp.]